MPIVHMNPAVQKTLTLFVLIAIGLILKLKIKSKDQLGGIKVLILSIALPATIFIALLKVTIDPGLLFLPVLALSVNLSLFMVAKYVLPLFSGYRQASPEGKTLMMLIPSFAPGLSCFPFIAEYLGEETLAMAALADVGNKIFGLILLYLLAMHWYYQGAQHNEGPQQNKVLGLLLALVKEPINLVIVTALVMLSFGWNFQSLPAFLQDSIGRLSLLMTPMVLIFIGLAVKVNLRSVKRILAILMLRSGAAFLMSTLMLLLLPITSIAIAALAVVFPQSSCSFWPFAHMSAVASLEQENESVKSTFNLTLALNILALSLPFSTMIILTICSMPDVFTNVWYLFGIGISMLTIGGLLQVKQVSSAYQARASWSVGK